MKGRYGGRHMTIYGSVLPGALRLANWAAKTDLSPKAKRKLKVVDWLRKHNGNVSLASRHFGFGRETIITWRNNFNRFGMLSLNDKSHKPKYLRKSVTDWKIVDEIVKIRNQYPAWSKYKIKAILKRNHIIISTSTIGRNDNVVAFRSEEHTSELQLQFH